MYARSLQRLLTHGACALILFSVTALARAQTGALSSSYYVATDKNASGGGDPDYGVPIDSAVVTGLVKNALSVNGLPVATALAKSRIVGSGSIKDLNASDEILWWKPHNSGSIVFIKVDSLTGGGNTRYDAMTNFASGGAFASNFYPQGQAGNATFHRTVHWQGRFTEAALHSETFTVGADDDAWMFVDNTLAVDNGGIKAIGSTSTLTTSYSAGLHSVDLFFADRAPTGSGIFFTSTIKIVPTPEPDSLALLVGLGICGSVIAHKRRSR
jgi:fibro-slime domain-containing protein